LHINDSLSGLNITPNYNQSHQKIARKPCFPLGAVFARKAGFSFGLEANRALHCSLIRLLAPGYVGLFARRQPTQLTIATFCWHQSPGSAH